MMLHVSYSVYPSAQSQSSAVYKTLLDNAAPQVEDIVGVLIE